MRRPRGGMSPRRTTQSPGTTLGLPTLGAQPRVCSRPRLPKVSSMLASLCFSLLWTKCSRFLRVTIICGASGKCMFSARAALPGRFSLGVKQTGSTPRADTDHFYNCLQQERKHELNSSVVDGFGGETRMNCQQDGFCFYPGICCRSLRSGCPAQSPGIYRHSLQVRPHCALQSQGLRRHLCRRLCQVCRGGSTLLRGLWEPPRFPSERLRPEPAPISLLSWSKTL